MPSGAKPPGSMYVCNLTTGERQFLKQVMSAARTQGGYTRVVEPHCSGTFGMLHVAREAGFATAVLECSDVHLFSALMAYGITGEPMSHLGLVCHADWADLPSLAQEAVAANDAPTLLWLQLYLKTYAQATNVYVENIAHELLAHRERYVAQIAAKLDRARSVFGPGADGPGSKAMRFFPTDWYTHILSALDDPRAIIALNAVCYKGGYEKFYDTGDLLTWDAPDYELFDPVGDKQRIMELAENAAALVIHYDEAETGQQAGHAVMVTPDRRNGRTGNVHGYLATNRPDEVRGYVGHVVVDRGKETLLEPLPYPVIGPEYVPGVKSSVQVVSIKATQAGYYRQLWTHKFVGGVVGENFALLLDGRLAGVFGYNPYFTAVNPQFQTSLLLTYGMAPGQYPLRLNRLITRIACTKELVWRANTPVRAARCEQVVTSQMTRHPESKEMRGLMKLVERKHDPKLGYKLVYARPVDPRGFDEVLAEWLRDETRYVKEKGRNAHGKSQ